MEMATEMDEWQGNKDKIWDWNIYHKLKPKGNNVHLSGQDSEKKPKNLTTEACNFPKTLAASRYKCYCRLTRTTKNWNGKQTDGRKCLWPFAKGILLLAPLWCSLVKREKTGGPCWATQKKGVHTQFDEVWPYLAPADLSKLTISSELANLWTILGKWVTAHPNIWHPVRKHIIFFPKFNPHLSCEKAKWTNTEHSSKDRLLRRMDPVPLTIRSQFTSCGNP